jgi:Asp-tRNA(Asn)/Glu-tRNA(Gln) amidotransferase B subunit
MANDTLSRIEEVILGFRGIAEITESDLEQLVCELKERRTLSSSWHKRFVEQDRMLKKAEQSLSDMSEIMMKSEKSIQAKVDEVMKENERLKADRATFTKTLPYSICPECGAAHEVK